MDLQFISGGDVIQKSKTGEDAEASEDWLLAYKSRKILWEQTLDSITDPIFFLTADGVIFWTNHAALSFFGVEETDLLGRHCYEMVRRFGLNFSNCPYKRVLDSKKPESGMAEYGGVWHKERVDPVLGPDGEVNGAIYSIMDGSDRVHLQATTEKLNHLVTATDAAVVTTGPDNTIVGWNTEMERSFGFQAEDLHGAPIHDLVPRTYREMFARYAERATTEGGMQNFSMQGLKKSGEVMDVAVSLSPLHDVNGAVSGMIASSRNITGKHDVDMRLVQYLTNSVEMITGPLSHIRTNMEETLAALQEGLLSTEELVIFLSLQMKAISLIEENLKELNNEAIEGIDEVPDEFRNYLAR